jgi:hypothetical protein
MAIAGCGLLTTGCSLLRRFVELRQLVLDSPQHVATLGLGRILTLASVA